MRYILCSRFIRNIASSVSGDALDAPGLVIVMTDAKYARTITNNVYYFWPMILMPQDVASLHSADERISTANLAMMAEHYGMMLMMGEL